MIPLFFILSGAAVYYALKFRTAGGFVKERTLGESSAGVMNNSCKEFEVPTRQTVLFMIGFQHQS
jgi:hypothetical protein